MKDATGELSMTAVAIVAIAAIAVVVTTLIYPTLRNRIIAMVNCSSAYSCEDNNGSNQKLCYYDDIDDNGTQIQKTVYCANND